MNSRNNKYGARHSVRLRDSRQWACDRLLLGPDSPVSRVEPVLDNFVVTRIPRDGTDEELEGLLRSMLPARAWWRIVRDSNGNLREVRIAPGDGSYFRARRDWVFVVNKPGSRFVAMPLEAAAVLLTPYSITS